ncbi:penicillin-binding protein 2 [Corynebacterium sp. TAE3-ERU12]|uniref:peptidoglycan D,D-transpeptidase FtsI family protein n=1 Tax=Corynebacterium sp. TAE3-ERU12 TaxID=2849491 RepID=UPI001C446CD5|nr:penicillin-binding protein 2 [Corynebacterium sp. TAE3-ERU12]MBV7296227.1 penicillin-binding protein 2 [Corynebacterium sp. TAE3-ERU12]
MGSTKADFPTRRRFVQIAGILVVLALVGRLAWLQLVAGPELAELAAEQRTVVLVDPARRGSINDRSGNAIAFTMEARSITVHPNSLRDYMEERHRLWPDEAAEPDERMKQIADELPGLIGVRDLDAIDERTGGRRRAGASAKEEEGAAPTPDDISSTEILKKLQDEKSTYEVLVRNVDPDKAAAVVEKFPELVSERQDIRQYPNGAVAANVVGKIGMDGVGQFGFEAARDAKLQGVNGGRTVDIAAKGFAIPGSTRDVLNPIDGTSYDLTLDIDMQYQVQQQLEQAKTNSGAKNAAAVVLDAHTGEILTMAQAGTANPNRDIGAEIDRGRDIGNIAVTSPFEPGSVAKIITAAAAIEDGLTTPDEVHTVPGSIDMAGVTVRDAWEHGDVPFTTTGIFGKSSNVGTLMLAERVGQDRFAEMLGLFGLGRSTGVELPAESPGLVPSREQWSGGTFANLPIGQGMAMSLLQMTSVYQTVANDGERIPPRIVESATAPDGTVTRAERPEGIRVMSPETARTVREMFQAVVQSDPTGVQMGTGTEAAVEGYQIAGKTGTAQKVDPNTGAYSNSQYYITFAGIAPADNPRFVIGIMLDEPVRGVHGEGGQSAAPLFHDIATWALDKYNVPPSPKQEGQLVLQAD